jgi:hypothetical protein
MHDTVADAVKKSISLRKAEDAEVVDPLDCWRDVMMFPYINSGIGYFALKTRSGGKTKWDIVIHVEKTLEVYHEVPFVIGFNGDRAIGTFHVQCSSLCSWRSSSHLRRELSDYVVMTRGERRMFESNGESLISTKVSFKRIAGMGPRYANNFLRKIREEKMIVIIMRTIKIT